MEDKKTTIPPDDNDMIRRRRKLDAEFERMKRRQRAYDYITGLFFILAAIATILYFLLLTKCVGWAAYAEPEPMETAEAVVEDTPEQEVIDPLKADKEALARMVWGEARGCSAAEQAAVVWCALNRFDSGDPYYANCVTIYDIVTQPAQFAGYDPENPVEPDILALVEDVLVRWMAEKVCVGDVGRVLPAEYLYFTGDGRVNTFRDQYQGGNTWDWSLDSPYED